MLQKSGIIGSRAERTDRHVTARLGRVDLGRVIGPSLGPGKGPFAHVGAKAIEYAHGR